MAPTRAQMGWLFKRAATAPGAIDNRAGGLSPQLALVGPASRLALNAG